MKISDFSIKRPVFTIVTMFLVIILGAVSFFRIPVTLIPELKPPIAVVVTSYPGASPARGRRENNEAVGKQFVDCSWIEIDAIYFAGRCEFHLAAVRLVNEH